ncbi:CARDB domain-containing protein [Brevibacillus migulae]|uniref:CARDB domain-containing protein n=1 Tax=Brevibacillus migulae TaxID=1644114 RepID=UPI0014308E40|nr:CARDB domain-containing protein [Brevibacillus migulae]
MKKFVSKILATAVVLTSLLPTTAFATHEDLQINGAYFSTIDREKQQVTVNFKIENYGSVKSLEVAYTVNDTKQTFKVNNLQPNEKREVITTINVPNASTYDLSAQILYDGRQDSYANDKWSSFAIITTTSTTTR